MNVYSILGSLLTFFLDQELHFLEKLPILFITDKNELYCIVKNTFQFNSKKEVGTTVQNILILIKFKNELIFEIIAGYGSRITRLRTLKKLENDKLNLIMPF